MPQPVIIQLPCGPVPLYAMRLVESLKKHGLTEVSISAGNVPSRPFPDFPNQWNPPSTHDSNWSPADCNRNHDPNDSMTVQLGTFTNQAIGHGQGSRISCSLFRDAAGPCFPELIRAMLKDDGYIEITASSTYTAASGISELKGYFKIIPHSYAQSCELALEGAIGLLVRMIVSNLSLHPIPTPVTIQPPDDGNPEALRPNSISVLRKKVRAAGMRKRFQQAFTIPRWNIGIVDAPIHEVALSINNKWEVKWMKELGGRDFRADPFGISFAEGKLILFERMHNDRGQIRALDEGLSDKVLLNDDTHFSYPYTFEANGIKYVVPESSDRPGVRIYPLKPDSLWIGNPIEIPLGIAAVDPSIVHYNDRWWLFCTDRSRKGADVRLHLFFADDLEGPWESHPMNPVKTDIRSARPAGHLFVHQGILYRPSQDSSITYGGRIIINRIDELDPTRFRETPLNSLEPGNFNGPYRSGIHTISALGDKTCIDGKRHVIHPFAFQRFLT